MYSYDSLFVKNKFLPSEIRIMNLDGSDKPCVCRNALQTSLIREKIRRRISSTINCEIQNRLQNYIFFGQFQIIYRKFAFYTTLLTLRRVRRRLPILVHCLCADYKHDNRTNPSDLRFPLAFRLLLPTFRQRARITVLPPLCRMPQCHRQVIEETFSHLIGSYGYILYGR